MKWIKFSEAYPTDVVMPTIYFDGSNISLIWICKKNDIFSARFYCTDTNCNWNNDNCKCQVIITDKSFWLPFPNQPERSKREDSQKCEMRCSELHGNMKRDK